jgi:hypothetical protein
MAASSIQGTGAQIFSSAMRNGCTLVSGIAFGPNVSSRRRASSLVRPVGASSFAAAEMVVAMNGNTMVVGFAVGALQIHLVFDVCHSTALLCLGTQ